MLSIVENGIRVNNCDRNRCVPSPFKGVGSAVVVGQMANDLFT
jgi:hypothetical protein